MEMPKLIPQPNGRGALLSGGVPGNKGSGGNIANKVRKQALELLQEHGVPALTDMIRDGGTWQEREAGIRNAVKIGLPTQIEAEVSAKVAAYTDEQLDRLTDAEKLELIRLQTKMRGEDTEEAEEDDE